MLKERLALLSRAKPISLGHLDTIIFNERRNAIKKFVHLVTVLLVSVVLVSTLSPQLLAAETNLNKTEENNLQTNGSDASRGQDDRRARVCRNTAESGNGYLLELQRHLNCKGALNETES